MEFGGSEITHHCWASRAQNSVCGSIVGVLLFFGSFALLGWNEARSVAEIRALNECAAKVVSVVSVCMLQVRVPCSTEFVLRAVLRRLIRDR